MGSVKVVHVSLALDADFYLSTIFLSYSGVLNGFQGGSSDDLRFWSFDILILLNLPHGYFTNFGSFHLLQV